MNLISAKEARELMKTGQFDHNFVLEVINERIKEAATQHRNSIEFPLDFRVSAAISMILTEKGYSVTGFDRLKINWSERTAPKGSDGLV